MENFTLLIDRISAGVGKAFAWCIILLTFGVGYEVFMRYVLRAPTTWAFDISYIMYGGLFMMAGAYTLSRNAHVRGDVVYRLMSPRGQGLLDLTLYILFFFPSFGALLIYGFPYMLMSWRFGEVSIYSPAGVPIYPSKTIIVLAARRGEPRYEQSRSRHGDAGALSRRRHAWVSDRLHAWRDGPVLWLLRDGAGDLRPVRDVDQ